MFRQIRKTSAETICLTLLTYNKVLLNTMYWKCLQIFTWEPRAAVLTQADLPLMSVGIVPERVLLDLIQSLLRSDCR